MKVFLIIIACGMCFCQEKIDGVWTEWSIMSSTTCSQPCDGGEFQKIRTCTNPKPQNGGTQCQGPDQVTESCNAKTCEDTLLNSEWGEWSECSTTCGLGVRTRVRDCVLATGDDFKCEKEERTFQKEECKKWKPYMREKCPDPCDRDTTEYINITDLRKCPDQSKCEDKSTDRGPKRKCICVMGTELDEKNFRCIDKPPVRPTPRPIPTLSPVEKIVAVVVTKTASTVILIMVSLTLVLFLVMRIFTVDRVIQMNMEVAILSAHLFLLFPNEMSTDNPDLCQVVSICLHLLFTSCFMFMMLEALHVYSLVSFVVTRNGLLSRFQNMLIGWGISLLIVVVSVCFFLDDYGAEYHCWLRMNSALSYLVIGPVACICVINLVLLEAAGVANYKPLKEIDHKQLLSCKIHQRCNLILMPMILASWILGMLSDYEQNLALYSVFSILNTVIGVCIFFFHCLGNQEVRNIVKKVLKCCFKSNDP